MFKLMSQLIFLSLATVLMSTAVMAAEESAESPPKEWKGEAELGLVNTSGNTKTDILNLKAKIAKEQEKWRHSASVSELRTSDDTGTTAQRLEMKGQTDYKFAKHDYIFGLITYENDHFSGYQYRASESVGYGRRVLDRPDMTLDLEAGPGARQSKLDDGSSDNKLILRAAAKYAWAITKTSNFSEDLSTESGSDATVSKSVTALTSKINGSLAMRLSYTIKYASSVPPNIANTDTETAVTLVYSY
jgi:putative salt-induced outer membrane protein